MKLKFALNMMSLSLTVLCIHIYIYIYTYIHMRMHISTGLIFLPGTVLHTHTHTHKQITNYLPFKDGTLNSVGLFSAAASWLAKIDTNIISVHTKVNNISTSVTGGICNCLLLQLLLNEVLCYWALVGAWYYLIISGSFLWWVYHVELLLIMQRITFAYLNIISIRYG